MASLSGKIADLQQQIVDLQKQVDAINEERKGFAASIAELQLKIDGLNG